MPKGTARKTERRAETHLHSPTAVAGEALSRGTVVGRVPRQEEEIPREGEVLRAGDPDVSALTSEYVGDEVPGGSMPTPDQDSVDATGRFMGVQEEDEGPGGLHSSSELLDRRDRRRALQDEPDPTTR